MLPTEFEKFQTSWKTILVGVDLNMEEPVTRDAIRKLSLKAESHIQTIVSDQSYLWRDLSPIQLSTNFRSCYNRLRTLALAYSVAGTSLYQDAITLQTILRSLDQLKSEAFNSSTKVNHNENVEFLLKYLIWTVALI
jgi:hyaluronate lyase